MISYQKLRTKSASQQSHCTHHPPPIKKCKATEILAEEQAGFRAGRSAVEQIFNCNTFNELSKNFIEQKRSTACCMMAYGRF
ncbi:hypothetical protein DPMN_180647 [Dreissena polymorpha]|uniref:Uncharacterized protein n=1 Tax=Dreissena polymorpha TaxID=45954 RepID=A0A9D4EGC5_DREPO|nr:hypothetical protein DPMN_180647 [Dreissena polymorpha]